MKKLLPVIFIFLPLTVLPLLGTTAGKEKDPNHQTIERIERKYKELRENTPAAGLPHSIRFIQPEDRVTGNYGELRQIALVRHGEPDMVKTGRFNAAEAQKYLQCYDSVCIIVPGQPFFLFDDKEEVKVFSSPLNRAFTTAKYLCGPDKKITVSPEFREFETSLSNRHSDKRFPIRFWTTTARFKWMLGMGKQKDVESFSDAKKRARRAAQILVDASEKDPKILLTAHGFLNRYIKKELVKKGWRIVEDNGNAYLGTTILVKIG